MLSQLSSSCAYVGSSPRFQLLHPTSNIPICVFFSVSHYRTFQTIQAKANYPAHFLFSDDICILTRIFHYGEVQNICLDRDGSRASKKEFVVPEGCSETAFLAVGQHCKGVRNKKSPNH